LPVYYVDAFADAPFTGNPAAVVVLQRRLAGSLMQAIAAEHNLSETAFVIARDGAYKLRWFTPRMEVAICGHATLATAFVLTRLHDAAGMITFDTKSGPLTVTSQDETFTLDFPVVRSGRLPQSDIARMSGLLGQTVVELHDTGDRYLCVMESAEAIQAVMPDMLGLSALSRPGIIVTAGGRPDSSPGGADFVSRYFAPAKGVPEDPVTGAAHCVLAPFWAERLGKSRLRAYQASVRGGWIDCEVKGDRVLLGGRCRLYLQGQIVLDS